MKLETLTHRLDSGWSAPLPTTLNSDRTLALVFGSSCCPGNPTPIKELGAVFPSASVLGCSTSGEIVDEESGSCDLHNQTMTLTTYSEH